MTTGSRNGPCSTSGLIEYHWSRQTAIVVDFQVAFDEVIRLPPIVEVQFIGIIQEALANVRKHAGVRHVRVSVRGQDGTAAVVVIQDDGRGFDSTAPSDSANGGFGLDTMRERAESVGGKLQITSRPGGGTRVEVELPTTNPAGRPA
jgi:signal transduction histidine kinase